MNTYQVIDRQTGRIMGTYDNARRARARRDRLDLQYGAVRYFVRLIESTGRVFDNV